MQTGHRLYAMKKGDDLRQAWMTLRHPQSIPLGLPKQVAVTLSMPVEL